MEREHFFCPVCNGLSEEAINRVLSCAQTLKFKNQNVYRQNDSYKGLYVLSEGQVRLTCYNEEGNVTLVKILYKNSTFGESGVAGRKYLENAYAIGETICVFISAANLVVLQNNHPELSKSLLSAMGSWMVEYYNRFMTLSLQSVRARLEHYLAEEAKKANSNEINFNLRRHEVASNLGIRPETLSRTLKELQEQGLVARRGNALDVHNLIQRLNLDS